MPHQFPAICSPGLHSPVDLSRRCDEQTPRKFGVETPEFSVAKNLIAQKQRTCARQIHRSHVLLAVVFLLLISVELLHQGMPGNNIELPKGCGLTTAPSVDTQRVLPGPIRGPRFGHLFLELFHLLDVVILALKRLSSGVKPNLPT